MWPTKPLLGWSERPTLKTVWSHTAPRRTRTIPSSHEITGQKETHPRQVSQPGCTQARGEKENGSEKSHGDQEGVLQAGLSRRQEKGGRRRPQETRPELQSRAAVKDHSETRRQTGRQARAEEGNRAGQNSCGGQGSRSHAGTYEAHQPGSRCAGQACIRREDANPRTGCDHPARPAEARDRGPAFGRQKGKPSRRET